MTSTKRRPTRKLLLDRPFCERLETRIALSTVIGTDPGPGVIFSTSPTAFRVTFDAPIDPITVGTGDILLDQVAADGSLVPVAAGATQETLDGSGTVLTLGRWRASRPRPLPHGLIGQLRSSRA